MAIFDWNMDGKKDIFDSFLEYKIFTECMEEDEDENEFDDFDDFDDFDEDDEF